MTIWPDCFIAATSRADATVTNASATTKAAIGRHRRWCMAFLRVATRRSRRSKRKVFLLELLDLFVDKQERHWVPACAGTTIFTVFAYLGFMHARPASAIPALPRIA